jgi:hypothetical protein
MRLYIATHNITRFVKLSKPTLYLLVDEIGIVPLRRLLCNSNVSNPSRYPNCGGIGPVNSLPLKSSCPRRNKFPNVLGMLPLKALSCRSKTDKLEIFPNSSGMGPPRFGFPVRIKPTRLERFPMAGGRPP